MAGAFPAPLAPFAPIDLEKFDQAAFEAAWNRLEQAQAKVNGLVSQAAPAVPTGDSLPTDVQQKLDKARQAGATASLRSRIIGWGRRGVAAAAFIGAGWALVSDGFDLALMVLTCGAAGLMFTGAFASRAEKRLTTARQALFQRCRVRRDDLAALAQRSEPKPACATGIAARRAGNSSPESGPSRSS